jgi:carboxyl-terminal processing protease
LSGSPDLKGLVVDLRGNGGGFRTILESILGDFVSGQVGTFFSQTSSYALTITGKPLGDKLSSLPVVVLVDQGTESYAEVLSASIQEKRRAKVVGVATAGNTETIYAYNLEDGSRLWCAQEGFKLLDGTNLEGRGVIPDEIVNVDWTAYQEADDPQILKALDILHGAP